MKSLLAFFNLAFPTALKCRAPSQIEMQNRQRVVTVEELGTFVTAGVRDDYESDSYVIYVDLAFNTPYLQTMQGFRDSTHHAVLEDADNDVAFDISFF